LHRDGYEIGIVQDNFDVHTHVKITDEKRLIDPAFPKIATTRIRDFDGAELVNVKLTLHANTALFM